jgi:MFS family permease
VAANPNLRRLELAGAGSVLGQWAFGVALAVFAYGAGGAGAAALVVVIRLVPSALAAPLGGALADRYPRRRVMIACDLIRAAIAVGAAVAALAGAGAPVVFALAAGIAVVSTAFRPAEAAALPVLARTPDELAAANVASSTIASVGTFAGPALGGLLLAATSTAVSFAATAVSFVWSALLIARIRVDPAAASTRRRAPGRFDAVGAGFRVIARDGRLRLVIGLYAAQTLVFGVLSVLLVVMALDVLALGDAGVGLLTSAIGIGGLLGAIATAATVGSGRLGYPFAAGIALSGAPVALIGGVPETGAALLLLGLFGIGDALVEVIARTLIQRIADEQVLGRVFGALESLVLAAVAGGALLAPGLLETLGARGALATTGSLLPVLVALTWRALARLDAPADRRAALLRSVPFLAPLPTVTVDRLASELVDVRARSGEEVIRQGDAGDRFYVIADGTVDVLVDGAVTGRLGVGDYFGEIALLREVPRTATVLAATDVLLHALERAEFLAAVAGDEVGSRAADAVVAARLGPPHSGLTGT